MAMKKQIKIDTIVTNVKANSRAIKEMAEVIDKLRLSTNRIANQNPRMSKGLEEMAKHMTKLKTETGQATIKFGAMLYAINAVGDRFGQFSRSIFDFGIRGAKSLTEVATSFEYIKAGLDFAFGYKSQNVMKRALDVAQETNISTREVLDVTRSLGVLKIDPFRDMINKKGQVQTALQSMADLAALVPQQGMEGALFAIRNALSGQWRSLQMRFDIPLNIIENIRKNITTTMGTQQRFDTIMQGITDHFGGLMAAVQNTTKFSIDNIKDIFTNLMYDISKSITPILTPFFKEIESYLKGLRKNDAWIKSMSASLVSTTKFFVSMAKTIFTFFKLLAEHQGVLKFIGALALMTAGLSGIVFGMSKAYVGISLLKAAFSSGTTAVTAFTGAMRVASMATGLGAIIAIVGTLAAAWWNATKAVKTFKDIKEGMTIEEASTAYSEFQRTAKQSTPFYNAVYGTVEKGGALSKGQLTSGALVDIGNALISARKVGAVVPEELLDALNLKRSGEGVAVEAGKMNLSTGARFANALTQAMDIIQGEASQRALGKGASLEAVKTGALNYSDLYKQVREVRTGRATEYNILRERFTALAKTQGKTPKDVQNALSYMVGKYSRGEELTTSEVEKNILNPLGILSTAKTEKEIPPIFDTMGRLVAVKGKGMTAETAMMAFSPYQRFATAAEGGYSRPLLSSISETIFNKYRQGFGNEAFAKMMSQAGTDFKDINGQSSQEQMRQAINNALSSDTEAIKLENLLKRLGASLDTITDNTEDTAKNTKKVEELLPPIFREIFDKFTRRGMLAGQGRAAFLGAR